MDEPPPLAKPRAALAAANVAANDVRIDAAAAEMPADGSLDVVTGRVGRAFQKRGAAHDETRCAKAALKASCDERFLHRVKALAVHEPLDRRTAAAVSLNGKHHA